MLTKFHQGKICSLDTWLPCMLFCIAIWYLALLEPTVGAEPNKHILTKADNNNANLLFDGQSFRGWKQSGNWKITNGAFYCTNVNDRRRNDLRYRKRLPGNCEVIFVWKERPLIDAKTSTHVKDARRLNPGLGINFNSADRGKFKADSSYGAGVDYYVSGIDIRLHTRDLDDESPLIHEFKSGYANTWPAKDFSKPIGQWNQSIILCRGSRIQFWLNGNKAFDINLASEDSLKSLLGNNDMVLSLAIEQWIKRKKRGFYLRAYPRTSIRVYTYESM